MFGGQFSVDFYGTIIGIENEGDVVNRRKRMTVARCSNRRNRISHKYKVHGAYKKRKHLYRCKPGGGTIIVNGTTIEIKMRKKESNNS